MNYLPKLVARNRQLLLAIVALPCLLLCCNASAQDETLRWKLQKGDRFRYQLDQMTQINSEVDKQKRLVENEISLVFDWQVDKVTEDKFEIRQELISLKLKTFSPTTGKRVVVDSTVEPEKPTRLEKSIATQLKPILGTEFILTMTSRGAIEDVRVSEEVLEQLRKVPGSLRIRELFTPEGLKSLYGQSLLLFPEEAVKAGFEWQVEETKESTMGKLLENRNHQIKRPAGQNNFEVTVTSRVTQVTPPTDKDSTVTKDGEQQVRITLDKFSGTGNIVMDAQNSFIRSSQFTNRMTTSRPYRELKLKTAISTTISSRLEKTTQEEDAPKTGDNG